MEMFEIGDAVVHPIRGAGVVTDIEELRRQGESRRYYKIKLLDRTHSKLMIPVKIAESRGLREAVKQSKLDRVWHIVQGDPTKLPSNYKTRYKILESRLRTGDVLQIAETLRDLVGRLRERGHLTGQEKRFYEKSVDLLAGEIAAVRDIDLVDAEAYVRRELAEILPPGTEN